MSHSTSTAMWLFWVVNGCTASLGAYLIVLMYTNLLFRTFKKQRLFRFIRFFALLFKVLITPVPGHCILVTFVVMCYIVHDMETIVNLRYLEIFSELRVM